jgi:3-phenylpropionate/trans-cinnamate dioxygenase ferredoxin component
MERIRVATLGGLAEGGGRRVDVLGHRIALFREGGEVFALGDRCSHAEASLSEGEVIGGTVECPRHGATFDLRTGEALALPATHGMPVYRAEVEGDDVYLWVEPAAGGTP